MVKIFAKQGTDEKALVSCKQTQVGLVVRDLQTKYGGKWLFVDKLHPNGELLHFNDGVKYLGFSGNVPRYCAFIENIED